MIFVENDPNDTNDICIMCATLKRQLETLPAYNNLGDNKEVINIHEFSGTDQTNLRNELKKFSDDSSHPHPHLFIHGKFCPDNPNFTYTTSYLKSKITNTKQYNY